MGENRGSQFVADSGSLPQSCSDTGTLQPHDIYYSQKHGLFVVPKIDSFKYHQLPPELNGEWQEPDTQILHQRYVFGTNSQFIIQGTDGSTSLTISGVVMEYRRSKDIPGFPLSAVSIQFEIKLTGGETILDNRRIAFAAMINQRRLADANPGRTHFFGHHLFNPQVFSRLDLMIFVNNASAFIRNEKASWMMSYFLPPQERVCSGGLSQEDIFVYLDELSSVVLPKEDSS